MNLHRITWLCVLTVASVSAQPASRIEPNAGNWKTGIISSGKDYRAPPPPGAAATKAELDWLRGVVRVKSPDIANSVTYWDAGSPAYRWIDLMTNRIAAGANITAFPHHAYLATAM
jgi:hypothetical protein